jgi:Na+-transporting NADH:ubiquinone oxidoreductase subunit NqrB
MLNHDARNDQIILLTTFLLLGIVVKDWTIKPDLVLVLWVSTLGTQVICSWIFKADKINWRSAIITSLSLVLLLRANNYLTIAIAGCLGISSKFLLRWQNKHIFNPANFGIISSLVLTSDAWISPGQWGTNSWLLILFLSTGTMITQKVGRSDICITFLLVYTGLIVGRNLWLGWSWDVMQHQLSNGSLLLFAFFMISDPRSTPKAQLSRILWGISLALVGFSLQTIWFMPTGLFWSLFILSPVTIVLDWLWSAPEFNWHNTLETSQPL